MGERRKEWDEAERLDLNDLHDVCTAEEIARFLGVSTKTVWRLAGKGELSSFTVGTRRLFPKQGVIDFIAPEKQEEAEKDEDIFASQKSVYRREIADEGYLAR